MLNNHWKSIYDYAIFFNENLKYEYIDKHII